MDTQILQLALEALQAKKSKIEQEIGEIQAELKGTRSRASRTKLTQSQRMKAYWRRRKAESAKMPETPSATPKRKPKSAAEKKAQSERMKAIWAKRRAQAKKAK